MFRYFDEQYAFCRSCVTVNNETMEDLNNCRCIECALSSLKRSCFQDYCTSNDEYEELLVFIEQFQSTNKVIDNGVTLKSNDNKFSSKKLSYFVGQNHTIFRNPLPFEKKQLISALLNSLTNNQDTKSSFDMFKKIDTDDEIQILHKRGSNDKTLSESPSDVDRSENHSGTNTKKQGNDSEDNGTKEINEDACSVIFDENDSIDNSLDSEKILTKNSPFHTATKTHTTYPSSKQSWTPLERRTVSTSYLVDECQGTKAITTINSSHDTNIETETRTTLAMSTEERKVWFPKTTIITNTATTTSSNVMIVITTNLLLTEINAHELKKKTGIKVGIFSANDEAVSSDERSVQTEAKSNRISNPGTASQQTNLFATTTPHLSPQSALGSSEYISAASQLDKRIFLFTVITVSITTLMMLGLSYRSRVSLRDHNVDESEDDDDWSNEEIEFDEEYFYSLPVSIPEKGISLDKMAQQLGVE